MPKVSIREMNECLPPDSPAWRTLLNCTITFRDGGTATVKIVKAGQVTVESNGSWSNYKPHELVDDGAWADLPETLQTHIRALGVLRAQQLAAQEREARAAAELLAAQVRAAEEEAQRAAQVRSFEAVDIAREFLRKHSVKTLYHFTDKKNIDSIREHGGLYSTTLLAAKGIVVPRPGGNDWSRQADALKGVDSFVHLSFCDEHPMRFIAEKDGRIGPVTVLKVAIDVLSVPGIVCTPDVANKSGVPLFGLADAASHIDFEVITQRTDWRDPNVRDRLKKAQKAEVLVPDHVPLRLLSGL